MPSAKPPANRSQLKNVTLFSQADELTISPHTLALKRIKLPAQQPRRHFDSSKLAALVASIQQHGILEPLLVRPLNRSSYELVAGERRYRAAQQLGLKEVPVIIREMSGTEAFQLALIENLQREELTPIEETEGILQLLSLQLKKPIADVTSLMYRMQDEVKGKVPHKIMGTSEAIVVEQIFASIAHMDWTSFVSNRLPLLKLPDDILTVLRQGRLAYTKAQAIGRMKDAEQRQILLEEAIAQDLSLSQIKDRIATVSKTTTEADSPSLKRQIDEILSLAKRSKAMDNPKKKKRLEKLLSDLKLLLSDAE